jgi:hypothetical protein
LNSRGQREVWSKDKSKEEIGGSPDGMDSVNLAYAHVEGLGVGGIGSAPTSYKRR